MISKLRALPKPNRRKTLFQYIKPEVAGGFGSKTKLDASVHPPIVHELEYEFAGWEGNDIVRTFPCYIVTQRLREAIESSELCGVSFHDVMISTTPEFKQLHPELQLPTFYWIKVSGVAGVDDFGLAANHRLVVSPQARTLLTEFNLSDAIFEDYSS